MIYLLFIAIVAYITLGVTVTYIIYKVSGPWDSEKKDGSEFEVNLGVLVIFWPAILVGLVLWAIGNLPRLIGLLLKKII